MPKQGKLDDLFLMFFCQIQVRPKHFIRIPLKIIIYKLDLQALFDQFHLIAAVGKATILKTAIYIFVSLMTVQNFVVIKW